jgi:hypothetical protein
LDGSPDTGLPGAVWAKFALDAPLWLVLRPALKIPQEGGDTWTVTFLASLTRSNQSMG